MVRRTALLTGWLVLVPLLPVDSQEVVPLPGTQPLRMEGDIASALVAGVDRFLLQEIRDARRRRLELWKRRMENAATREAFLAEMRGRLARIVGVRDPRSPADGFELVATTTRSARIGSGDGFEVLRIRWPSVPGVDGEGLLLRPTTGDAPGPIADVIAVGDAHQTPEMLCGLVPGVDATSRFPLRLVRAGCRVVVPYLIDRGTAHSTTMRGKRETGLTHREFLYRPAFELGRHILGYEVQKLLAAVDVFRAENAGSRPVGIFGHGEGGRLALFAAALDARVDAVAVSGEFRPRTEMWREPIDRNVFGLLERFGDAELAAMVAPRPVVVEACDVAEVVVKPGGRGAPGRIRTASLSAVREEMRRFDELMDARDEPGRLRLVPRDAPAPGSGQAVRALLRGLGLEGVSDSGASAPARPSPESDLDGFVERRRVRQIRQIEAATQDLLKESAYLREEFWRQADARRGDRPAWTREIERYRQIFREQIIGEFDVARGPLRPRSRKIYQDEGIAGYEVVLDVFDDVFAYGILVVPTQDEGSGQEASAHALPGSPRPVVVCQHGLEGRPQDVALPGRQVAAYNRFAVELARRGFVTFSPQNLYIFGDRFRTLQRKANPIGKTLFSIMVPQHRQIVDWLETLPFVDAGRIAFYGLSYGGKSAMRIPPLVPEYCLSICSADFNEWIWKNASTRSKYSYVSTGEYEIFEFDLGMTFNYSDMAALIAPRPFMVERGHRDGVAPDSRVAQEYARVRLLYADLGIPERTRIEFFDGPHAIHGVGTFEFLHEHLDWPMQTPPGSLIENR